MGTNAKPKYKKLHYVWSDLVVVDHIGYMICKRLKDCPSFLHIFFYLFHILGTKKIVYNLCLMNKINSLTEAKQNTNQFQCGNFQNINCVSKQI